MTATRAGAFRIFRFAGIDVFLHWSWFLVAIWEIQGRSGGYSSRPWYMVEYLALFMLVTLHEFGHSLACRQVGGTADCIVLWPLGGIAYVSPPQRPGAMLWSIAAGPLVNVVLFPVLSGLVLLARYAGWRDALPDPYAFLIAIWVINLSLLIFNLLPIYPLDGGKILQSLLWFVLGRARSLMVAALVGFVGVAGLLGLAVWAQSWWMGVVAAFILLCCWGGLRQAQALARLAEAPRRAGFMCPTCHAAPIIGAFWGCSQCGKPFDTFATGAACPHCGTQFSVTKCGDCGALAPPVIQPGTGAHAPP